MFAKLRAKYFASPTEIERLNRLVAWYKELAEGHETEKKALKTELTAEIKRNRRREDELNAIIRELTTGQRDIVTPRDVTLPPQKDLLDATHLDKPLTNDERYDLWERAKEYAAQSLPEGVDVTDQDIDVVYKKMLKDPAEWLTN